jgi:hypothetical protein
LARFVVHPYALVTDHATVRGDDMERMEHVSIEPHGRGAERHRTPADGRGDHRVATQLARTSGVPYALRIDRALVRGDDTKRNGMRVSNGARARTIAGTQDTEARRATVHSSNEVLDQVRNRGGVAGEAIVTLAADSTDRARVAPAASLTAILSELPGDTMVPAAWVLERIELQQRVGSDVNEDTLSAQEFADLRQPRRTADWVREKCAAGWFVGAYKDGGGWRIPRAALTAKGPRSHQSDNTTSHDLRPTASRQDGVQAYPRW